MQINKILNFFIVPICFCMSKMHHLDASSAYAQLSSLTSQVPPISGNALIRLDSIDAIYNMDVTPDKQSVIIKEDGFYFVLAGAQVGSIDQTRTGYVDIWLVSNKKAVPNTNSRRTVEQPTSVAVVFTQAILSLKAGDRVGTGYSASGPSLGVIFLQPDNEPAVTSIIFTIFKM
jgi:hypothetical protein